MVAQDEKKANELARLGSQAKDRRRDVAVPLPPLCRSWRAIGFDRR
jgi:hypothetical protein